MADPRTSFCPETLHATLAALTPASAFTIAYSGGLDSHVLLHAASALWAERGITVQAVHVHHGLEEAADDWALHCEQVCQELRVPLRVERVDARAAPGESPEAAAREARYAAITKALGKGFELLSAHTLDDQAETLLLHLLRGCGVHGAAAMPQRRPLAHGWLSRPLLDVSRALLLDYAQAHALRWIEDPSNRDTGYDRNFLRHRVMPLLRERWPAAARSLARDAAHFADARTLLDTLAQTELERLGDGDTLDIIGLRELPRERRLLVLRHWLRRCGTTLPGAELLGAIDTLVFAPGSAQPEICWRGGRVRRYRDRLFADQPGRREREPVCQPLTWDGSTPLAIPGLAQPLTVELLAEMGAILPAGHRVTVGFRRGGERIRLAGHAHHKTLKQLFQEQGVPPWQREHVPLVYVDGELAVVVGVGVAEGFQRSN